MNPRILTGLLLILSVFASCKSKSSNNAQQASDTIRNIRIDTFNKKASSTISDTAKAQTVSSKAASTLRKVDMIFGTPAWGDGKNMHSSYVQVDVTIRTLDGSQYVGHGEFRDGTGIPPGRVFGMSIGFTMEDLNRITPDNIGDVSWIYRMWKPDEDGIRFDHWNFRSELVLIFNDDRKLATGYNDPPYWHGFSRTVSGRAEHPRPRSSFFTQPTLKEPVN